MIKRQRNIGIMAHIDAGKTTLTERILFATGRIHAVGEVHDGNTTTDFLEQERKKGITIVSAATTVFWSRHDVEYRLNVIDTPGHVDFTMEVERSLRVLDGAIAVFDASQGVEPQSETVWRQADKFGVPRIAFINKMDKVGASFLMCVQSLREKLLANAVAMQMPMGEGAELSGVIDLVTLRTDEGEPVPESYRAEAEAARQAMIEAIAEVDHEAAAAYLEGRAVPVYEAVRRATLARAIVPVLCGAAYKNIGVSALLDAVVDYLPEPVVTEAPFAALAFKLMHDKNAGPITFLRVYAGELRQGQSVLNVRKGVVQRVGRVVIMHANKMENVARVEAGDICAVLNLRDVRTGDTLCDERHPVVLEALTAPEPVMTVAIEPRSQEDQRRMEKGLQMLTYEDPSLRTRTDPDSGQVLLLGMGELHLEIAIDRLLTEHGAHVRMGDPHVAYRQTLRGTTNVEYTHSRQNGGPGQWARIIFEAGPAARGEGLVFADETKGGVLPKELVPSIEKGMRAAMGRSDPAIVDVRIRLLDGDTHVRDSTPQAFEAAGYHGFLEAIAAAGTITLEPVMAVEVHTPHEWLGEVLSELSLRRGRVLGMDVRRVEARVPLAQTTGLVTSLRSRTQGRASPTMQLHAYEPVP